MNNILLILSIAISFSLSSFVHADEPENASVTDDLVPTISCRPYPHCLGDDIKANFEFNILKLAK